MRSQKGQLVKGHASAILGKRDLGPNGGPFLDRLDERTKPLYDRGQRRNLLKLRHDDGKRVEHEGKCDYGLRDRPEFDRPPKEQGRHYDRRG